VLSLARDRGFPDAAVVGRFVPGAPGIGVTDGRMDDVGPGR